MSSVGEARDELARIRKDMGDASKWLADVSRELHNKEGTGIGDEYRRFSDDYELGLLERSETSDYKLPSADLRAKLVRRKFTEEHPEKMGRYLGLTASRDRLIQRISDLKHEAESQRSILSALKVEMEAGESASPPKYEDPIGRRRA